MLQRFKKYKSINLFISCRIPVHNSNYIAKISKIPWSFFFILFFFYHKSLKFHLVENFHFHNDLLILLFMLKSVFFFFCFKDFPRFLQRTLILIISLRWKRWLINFYNCSNFELRFYGSKLLCYCLLKTKANLFWFLF